MTVIAALIHEGHAWIGADRLVIFPEYDFGFACADPKITRVGRTLAGFSGSAALTYKAIEIVSGSESDNVEDLLSRLRGELDVSLDEPVELEGLFASPSKIVRVCGDLIPLTLEHKIGACGSGGMLALGSLSTSPPTADPRERLKMAISAAEEFCPAVGGGCDYLTTKDEA